MPDQITPIEAFWDFISLVGIVYSLRVMHRYRISLFSANQLDNVEDRPTAITLVSTFIGTESRRLLCHVTSLVIGVQASYLMPHPPVHPPTGFERFYGIEVVLGFIIINLATVANSFFAYRSWVTRYGILAKGGR